MQPGRKAKYPSFTKRRRGKAEGSGWYWNFYVSYPHILCCAQSRRFLNLDLRPLDVGSGEKRYLIEAAPAPLSVMEVSTLHKENTKYSFISRLQATSRKHHYIVASWTRLCLHYIWSSFLSLSSSLFMFLFLSLYFYSFLLLNLFIFFISPTIFIYFFPIFPHFLLKLLNTGFESIKLT